MSQSAGKSEWTEAEAWAWQEIAAGRIADFNRKYRKLDPLSNKGWNAKRTLSASFLKAILFDGELRSKVPVAGVRIAGARWCEPLDLAFAPAPWPLCFERCRFEAPVDLTGLQIERRLSAKGSAFQAKGDRPSLDLSRSRARWADLSEASFANGLRGRDAAFGGALDLTGAFIAGKLDLERAALGSLFLTNGTSDELLLELCGIDRQLDLKGIEVKGDARMEGIHVGHGLQMGSSAERGSVFSGDTNLISAFVGGEVVAIGATFRGSLDMNGAEIAKHLFLRSPLPVDRCPREITTRFEGELDLSFCKVSGHLDLSGSTIEGKFSLMGAQVGENLTSYGGQSRATTFDGEADLSGARVGGNLDFCGCRFVEALNLNSARVGGTFFLGTREDPIACQNIVDMAGMQIGYQLQVSGQVDGDMICQSLRVGRDVVMLDKPSSGSPCFRAALDLRSARIEGQLRLPLWNGDACSAAHLDLRDAHAGSLEIVRQTDPSEIWPKGGGVNLDGFTYDRLGGTGTAGDETAARPAKWLERWLSLDKPYSPQPYEYLATILRQAGEVEKAHRILYAGRKRAWAAAWLSGAYLRGIGLTLSWILIGFGIGYRFFLALFWAAVLTVVGMYMLGPLPIGAADGAQLLTWLDKAAYSFDQLLPIIELDRRFSAVELPEGVEQHYFYAHRIFGYILGSFIAAGVAGLTQRSRS